MENKQDTRRRWIDLGYELFSEEGPEGLQVERLARILELNKSGFYHYFGTMENYILILFEHNQNNIELYCQGITKLKDFESGYAQLMIDHKDIVLFHIQLSKHRFKKIYYDEFLRSNKKIESCLIPLWANYVGIRNNRALAESLYFQVRDIFITRATPKNLDKEFLNELINEFKNVINKVKASSL
jgi:AcrR family transcriptional regulator